MTEDHNAIGMLGPLAGYHLRRASAAFGADFVRAMDGTGMRQVLVAILAVVASNPDINQGAVGRLLGVKRANMVSLIGELADAGLIGREVDPTDRRAFVLRVTDAGRAMLSDCLARIGRHEDRMLAGFSAAERVTLLEFLSRIERIDPAS